MGKSKGIGRGRYKGRVMVWVENEGRGERKMKKAQLPDKTYCCLLSTSMGDAVCGAV